MSVSVAAHQRSKNVWLCEASVASAFSIVGWFLYNQSYVHIILMEHHQLHTVRRHSHLLVLTLNVLQESSLLVPLFYNGGLIVMELAECATITHTWQVFLQDQMGPCAAFSFLTGTLRLREEEERLTLVSEEQFAALTQDSRHGGRNF